MIRLTDEEIQKLISLPGERAPVSEYEVIIAKAQLGKDADTIDSMTAGGWFLEDIVKAMRKEAE